MIKPPLSHGRSFPCCRIVEFLSIFVHNTVWADQRIGAKNWDVEKVVSLSLFLSCNCKGTIHPGLRPSGKFFWLRIEVINFC